MESLRRHRINQLEHRLTIGGLWEDHNFVFTNQSGGPLAVNVLSRHFQKLIAAAKVPVIRFHDMRHSCATLLLAGGVHPKVVQERLGHSDVGITLNRYSHVSPQMQRDAADALDALVTKAGAAAS
ncbi:MAG: tyrosine-type recombinase/integrase [Chloroflexia bacterium]|nr:tyrosine-type recombinase/integrase [Chloroflexia bacterium]